MCGTVGYGEVVVTLSRIAELVTLVVIVRLGVRMRGFTEIGFSFTVEGAVSDVSGTG